MKKDDSINSKTANTSTIDDAVSQLSLSTEAPRRETPSENKRRLRKEATAKRKIQKKEEAEAQKRVPTDPGYLPTRQELLNQGFVRAKLIRGPQEWVYFTVPEWTAFTPTERMRYVVDATPLPGNHIKKNVSSRVAGTRVHSSFGDVKKF